MAPDTHPEGPARSVTSSRPAKPAPDASGHAGHVRDADAAALPGRMLRPIKLVFLGAGSFFAPRLVNDVVRIEGNRGGTIALVDIDEQRLGLTARLVEKLLGHLGGADWKLVATTDRKAVLAGAHYIVNCIEVSGVDCVRLDNDIPLRYGVDQCIGDTIGPGGLFKALRTIPVWLDVLRDCERLCPDALVLNYTNPMAMLCLAAARTSRMRVVGLCHSVQGTSRQLADYAGVPYSELEWDCAGINHLAWFTTLRHAGKDLYPGLREKFAAEVAEGLREAEAGRAVADSRDPGPEPARVRDLVRKEICLQFGAFVTESSGHLSEYLPYFRKSASGRRLLRVGYDGGSRFYATNWPRWRANADRDRVAMLEGRLTLEWPRSLEYAAWIIEACEKDAPFRFHGNVMNTSQGAGPLISNLPADGCVEVACLADRTGIRPVRFGPLPPHLAAVSASNMGLFELGAGAAIERSVEKAVHALLLDPLTAAVCTPAEIRSMTLELFDAEKEFLSDYR